MSQYKVSVKWGKEKLAANINTNETPDVFKMQLFSLTNVLPERQKVMIKGKVLKDNWSDFKLKNGLTILLLGSAEAVHATMSEPIEKTKFMEDMTEDELNSAMDMNTGLDNLGNTCYMNATVQMLSTVPEFSKALQNINVSQGRQQDQLGSSIAVALGGIMKTLQEKKQATFNPFLFLQLIYSKFPRFAEKNERGIPMQQDANEFFGEILRICQNSLPSNDSRNNLVEQFFGIEYANTMKCMDEGAKDEAATHGVENSLQLNCFINQEVKYLMTGVKSKLKEELEKNSPTLGRNAKYEKTSKINRLPGYLCVQMVRFFYKEKGSVNAKILKDVKFPMSFDAYELCTAELQNRLKPQREKFEAVEEAKAEAALSGNKKPSVKDANVKKEVLDYENYSFDNDVGSSNSGYYELQAIITHQGRSSSSGHYVGWLRVQEDDWVKCDDDDVTAVSSEEVLKLSGGGDWHIAYILLYGPKRMSKKDAKLIQDKMNQDAANQVAGDAVSMDTN